MKPTDPQPEANPLLDQLLAEAGRENERMHLAQADKYMRYAPQPEALAAPLEPRCPKCGCKAMTLDYDHDSSFNVMCHADKTHYWDALELADFAQFFPNQNQQTKKENANVYEATDRSRIEVSKRVVRRLATGGVGAGTTDRGDRESATVAAEPHTLTREQILVKALEVLRDKWPQSHADFRGMTLIELLDYQRSLIAGLMADFVLSLSPSTRPSGEGWIKCSERLPHSHSVLGYIVDRPAHPVFVGGEPFVDTVTYFPQHDPHRVIKFAEDIPEAGEWRLNGMDEEDDRGVVTVTAWQPLPAPPTEEKGPSQ